MGIVNFVIVPETTALIVGRTFGRNNFSYFISPKKTLEGLAGQYLGVFVSVAINEVHMYFMPSLFPFHFSVTTQLITGFFIITVSVLGDLVESILKRSAKTKDSSQFSGLSKGLGGFLDKWDSLGPAGLVMMITAIFMDIPRN